jgi:hypothetical protein
MPKIVLTEIAVDDRNVYVTNVEEQAIGLINKKKKKGLKHCTLPKDKLGQMDLYC